MHSGLALVGSNPSRGMLRFALDVAHDAQARVELFNVQGKKTATLAAGARDPGVTRSLGAPRALSPQACISCSTTWTE